jgi:hypothetical protein
VGGPPNLPERFGFEPDDSGDQADDDSAVKANSPERD